MKHSLALGRQGWQIKQDRAIEPTCAGSLLTQRQLIILDKTKFHSHCDQSQHYMQIHVQHGHVNKYGLDCTHPNHMSMVTMWRNRSPLTGSCQVV